jgi:hypothetical protein
MNRNEYEKWVETARRLTQERMDAAQKRFGLGGHARYEIDLSKAVIRFLGADGAVQVEADLQVAGSWSPASESWLWGWENQSVPEAASSRVKAVRERGLADDLPQLREAVSPCDEGEAWSLASIAAQILDAECVYRSPGQKSHLFLLLFSLRKK